MLEVRKVGYQAYSTPVDLTNTRPLQRLVQLDTVATPLPRVNILALAVRNAFDHRKRMGIGHFITEEQIEERHAQQFTDVLQSVSSLSLIYTSNGVLVTSARGGGSISTSSCIALAIDGVATNTTGGLSAHGAPGAFDNAIQPSDTAAVEIYTTATVPAQFEGLMNGCDGLVLVWTKDVIPR